MSAMPLFQNLVMVLKIQRYKGLGEMNAEQLWDTTMNPEFRTMRLVQIENGVEADRVFFNANGRRSPSKKRIH